MKKVLLTVLAAAVLLPTAAEAQRRVTFVKESRNPFTFSPYAGLYKDAMDISVDDENTGYTVGFRVGYDLGRRTRLLADVAYAHSDNVGNTPPGSINYNVYDNNWIFTTGGAEYDILPGPTSVTLGLQGGVAWRETPVDQPVGIPEFPDEGGDGYSSQLLIAPRLSVRHAFTGRTSLDVSVTDLILPDDGVDHMPSLTIGFLFR